MKISEVMTRNPEVVRPDATVEEAARKMGELNVGALPVCDGERLVGMLTDRDIAVRAIAVGRGPETKVRDVMSPDVFYCYEDDDVKQAEKLMEEKQVRRVLVLNRDKRLVGIVSLGDLALDLKDKQKTAEVLERVSEPAKPKR